ncbi:MAG: hypothetical protein C7B45_12935 [Sulfobacillus acidophilus]|uniref:Uncharacterized protein n=1 Tax=Sulfobacillus acidophilus TaxID=53633 RepID=A0A2T2WFD0_9FIRM|nr:MAG: hypothetical protein C7B45_12935 [Sulfobacillus acidophilus]
MKSWHIVAGLCILVILVVGFFVIRKPHAQLTAKTEVAIIRRMLVASIPSISKDTLPLGQSPSPALSRKLMHREQALLHSIYAPHSPGYEANWRLFRQAWSHLTHVRNLDVRVTRFKLVSVTQNSTGASAEWQGIERYREITLPQSLTRHIVDNVQGTTVLLYKDGHWRISSGASTATPVQTH